MRIVEKDPGLSHGKLESCMTCAAAPRRYPRGKNASGAPMNCGGRPESYPGFKVNTIRPVTGVRHAPLERDAGLGNVFEGRRDAAGYQSPGEGMREPLLGGSPGILRSQSLGGRDHPERGHLAAQEYAGAREVVERGLHFRERRLHDVEEVPAEALVEIDRAIYARCSFVTH